MSEQNLATIDIKGKKYVQVHERVRYFNETYPFGSITTELISSPKDILVFVKATVKPDCGKPERYFTGYSQAKWGEGYINKSSALENAETSAVGRALGMMGIGIVESLCTADEIDKAKSQSVDEEDFIPKYEKLNEGIIITPKDEKKATLSKIKEWMERTGVTEAFIIRDYAPSEFEGTSLADFDLELLKDFLSAKLQDRIEKRFKSE